jgi:hypothetical protein
MQPILVEADGPLAGQVGLRQCGWSGQKDREQERNTDYYTYAMPASRPGRSAAALAGYVCVAVAFTWPLPLHLGSAVLGPVSGDTGLYVWNLWVFRHEIVAHHAFPFFTREILSLTPPVSLTLHNYTTVANMIAFPLLPILGTAATFNVLVIASGALSAYALFLLARHLVRDDTAAWVAGLAYGFGPFMSARATGHLSLMQAAALPAFALLLDRLQAQPTMKTAAAAGVVVSWAFLSDPYYAVYCLLIAVLTVASSVVVVRRAPRASKPVGWQTALDLGLIGSGGLIAWIVVLGGGQLQVFGQRVSVTGLYTPVLLFTVLGLMRLWIVARPELSFVLPVTVSPLRLAAAATLSCVIVLSPVLYAVRSHWSDPEWINPTMFWRSSAPGHDLLTFFAPNPLHVWLGPWVRDWMTRMPNGFVENVASVPWVLIGVVLGGAVYTRAWPPRYWIVFTAAFGLLALGPFVRIAGVNTYVPTPWAVLRYVPIVGAARVPTRFAVLVLLGASVLLAFALRDLRARWRYPGVITAAVSGLLIFELLPAPRPVHPATAPSVYSIIAADPRAVRVLDLPFGLGDGMRWHGTSTSAWQYYQTVHEKPLLSGYISRLPRSSADYYVGQRVTGTLLRLSAGLPVSAQGTASAIARAHELRRELNIGYVVVDRERASEELIAFARDAFDLTYVTTDGAFDLYRTSLTPPLRPN